MNKQKKELLTKELLTIEIMPARKPEIGRFLWMLEAARGRLKRTLNGIDEQWLDWEPPYNGNSIGTLLYHIAAIEIDWLYTDVLQSEFPAAVIALLPFDVRDETGRLTAVPNTTLSQHIQRLDSCRAFLLDAFANMSPADFRSVRHLPTYDVTPEWVLYHLIQHETEHRGQIMEIHQQILTKNN